MGGGPERPATARWSTVSGLHAHPAEIHHDGHQRGLQLALTPAGARALLGVPARSCPVALELEDVAPGAGATCPSGSRAAAATPDRLLVVGAGPARALARHDGAAPRREVGRALAGLTRGARVHDVAAEVGYSRRRLGTLVREECGVAPKEFQRIARFERSRDVLAPASPAAADWPASPPPCGYADQSHLTREWACWRAARPRPGCARSSRSFKTAGEPRSAGWSPREEPPCPTRSTVRLWHSLAFRDADAMIGWLRAIGFTEHAVYRDEPTRGRRARRVLWPPGGGIMFGSHRDDNDLTSSPAPARRTSSPTTRTAPTTPPSPPARRRCARRWTRTTAAAVPRWRTRRGTIWSFGDYQPT